MRMRKWAAYLLCFLSLALLGISGHFLADYAKQEEKADILQEQLKEIYENDSDSEFYMPLYIGCCNGGGDWETISKMIEEICPFIILVNYDKRA